MNANPPTTSSPQAVEEESSWPSDKKRPPVSAMLDIRVTVEITFPAATDDRR